MHIENTIRYTIEHAYPGFEQQRFWDLFVDHEAWSAAADLPGAITIVEPGEGHPQGLGAVRSVVSGPMTILEDVVAFDAPRLFRYAARNGGMPVDDFVGELRLEQREDGLVARYEGTFTPKTEGSGEQLRDVFRSAQAAAFVSLGDVYRARYGA